MVKNEFFSRENKSGVSHSLANSLGKKKRSDEIGSVEDCAC